MSVFRCNLVPLPPNTFAVLKLGKVHCKLFSLIILYENISIVRYLYAFINGILQTKLTVSGLVTNAYKTVGDRFGCCSFAYVKFLDYF